MESVGMRPRKQRTREHIIADLSAHHVEGFILHEGHSVQRLDRGYGYDLVLFTYDEQGHIEPDSIYFQLKARESRPTVGPEYVFDLDVRDYNLWIIEKAPVILILYDASRKRAYWLHVQGYFRTDQSSRPKPEAKTVRVRVPSRQLVNRRAIARFRELKRRGRGPVLGVQS